jgi:glutaredoxin 3
VPLYSWRLWLRRFNQSAMLAHEVGRLAHVPVDCLALRRVRRTESQVGLSPDQRRRNVADAFKMPNSQASAVAGKSIVLIDDVITAGRRLTPVRGCSAGLALPGSTFSRSRGRLNLRRIPLRKLPPEPSYFSGISRQRRMARILLYTTPFCGYCRAAKNLLRAKGLEYDEIDVGADAGKRVEMVERAHGRRTVPQIFIHGRHVGGYDELAALEREGKLNDWLANALKTFGSETLASDTLRPTALAGATET